MAKKKTKRLNKLSCSDLEERHRLFSDLMDHVPDVIYFKDKKGRLIMVNEAHARGLGLKPEQVVGKTDFDIHPKERAEAMAKDDMHVLRTGKPIIDKIERATRPDGVDNYVSTTKIPRYDAKGNIIGLIGITRDITGRRQLEQLREEKEHMQKRLEATEEVSNAKSEFISIVSHELRTPLAVIKEAVMLLFAEMAGPINERQKEFLGKANENIRHLKSLIDELLDASRIEKGTLKLHYSLINLNDLLRDSSAFFKKLAQQKGVSLEYILPKEQVNIFLDAERVNRVVSNLVNNAIKFTEQNGIIKLELEILETKVRVSVKDTGVGIAKQDLPKLFKKFSQISKTLDTDRKGLGLGLSITKELVERHGGEIWAESRLGVGTKFYFTIPRFYTKRALDDATRKIINNLLEEGKRVHLINLLIVNFKEFKEKVGVNPKQLFKDMRLIIDEVLGRFNNLDSESSQILLEDYKAGEWSILFPEATETESRKLCELFRDYIKNYFIKNKIEGLFVNLGIVAFPAEEEISAERQKVPADITIKRLYIGLETRRFKRVSYSAIIEVIFPKDKTESCRTIDISEGGLCFISERKFKTDERVRIKLRFLKEKEQLEIKARVAWRKDIEDESKEGIGIYRIGLEFIGLKEKEQERLSRIINSIAS